MGPRVSIKNLADPNSPAPDLWKVKPDPAAEQPAEITQDILLHVPASFFGGEVTYPTAPSVFVAVGRNGDQKDVREFWDLSTRKRVGSLRGGVKVDKPYALSADGTLFAGKTDRSFTVYETRTGRLVAQLQVELAVRRLRRFRGGRTACDRNQRRPPVRGLGPEVARSRRSTSRPVTGWPRNPWS